MLCCDEIFSKTKIVNNKLIIRMKEGDIMRLNTFLSVVLISLIGILSACASHTKGKLDRDFRPVEPIEFSAWGPGAEWLAGLMIQIGFQERESDKWRDFFSKNKFLPFGSGSYMSPRTGRLFGTPSSPNIFPGFFRRTAEAFRHNNRQGLFGAQFYNNNRSYDIAVEVYSQQGELVGYDEVPPKFISHLMWVLEGTYEVRYGLAGSTKRAKTKIVVPFVNGQGVDAYKVLTYIPR
jgi:hypothetical protein